MGSYNVDPLLIVKPLVAGRQAWSNVAVRGIALAFSSFSCLLSPEWFSTKPSIDRSGLEFVYAQRSVGHELQVPPKY